MKQRTGLRKAIAKTGAARVGRSPRRKTISLNASAEERRKPYVTIEDVLGLYRPRKKAVTLRLDADVVDWFKKPGRGYQTRINRALRGVMWDEQKDEQKKAEHEEG